MFLTCVHFTRFLQLMTKINPNSSQGVQFSPVHYITPSTDWCSLLL